MHPSSMAICLHSIKGLEIAIKMITKKTAGGRKSQFPEACHFENSHTLRKHDIDIIIMRNQILG
jgi:hypothetical protein